MRNSRFAQRWSNTYNEIWHVTRTGPKNGPRISRNGSISHSHDHTLTKMRPRRHSHLTPRTTTTVGRLSSPTEATRRCVPFHVTLIEFVLRWRCYAIAHDKWSHTHGAPVENRLEARAVNKTSARETERAPRLPHSREKHSPDHFTLRASSIAMRFSYTKNTHTRVSKTRSETSKRRKIRERVLGYWRLQL